MKINRKACSIAAMVFLVQSVLPVLDSAANDDDIFYEADNGYFDVVTRMPSFPRSGYFGLSRAQYDKIYSLLDVQVDIQEIERIFDTFDFVMNRRPKHDQLTVGCGSLYMLQPGFEKDEILRRIYGFFFSETISNHVHKDVDTLDSNFALNPTIVSSFENPRLPEGFTHRYKTIVFEAIGVPFLPWEVDEYNMHGGEQLEPANPQIGENILALLADDGVVRISMNSEAICEIFKQKGIQIRESQIIRSGGFKEVLLSKDQIRDYIQQ